MIPPREKNLLYCFLLFSFLIGMIQMIHRLCGLPTYDILYTLLITGLFVLGDTLRRGRWLIFAFALFLLDLTPGFILIPVTLFVFLLRGIIPLSPQNVSLDDSSDSLSLKMGV